MKREKELETLRMNQWREKQTMMDKLREQERKAEERLAAVVKEQEAQAKAKAERAAEEAARQKAQASTLESLEGKVSWRITISRFSLDMPHPSH